IERIHECFRVFLARHVVEKSAGYQNLPLDVRRLVAEVIEGREGAERLTFDEVGGNAAAFRRRGSQQDLRWKDEEPVGIADGGWRMAGRSGRLGRLADSLFRCWCRARRER